MNTTHQQIDENTFTQLTGSIEEELANGHLSTALSIMSNLLGMLVNIPECNNAQEEVESATANYKRLLHYMAEGAEDPQRYSVQANLTHKVFRILQNIRRAYEIRTHQTVYTATAVLMGHRHTLGNLQELLQDDSVINDYTLQDLLFDILWTSAQLTSTEEHELNLFLISAPPHLQCYITSALTLALFHYFDPAKFRILIANTNATKEEVKVRAMVGLCLIVQVKSHQLSLFPLLADEVVSIIQAPEHLEELALIQNQINLYQESERFQQRFEKEIIPTLIKVSQQRRKLGFDDMEIDLTNPESAPNVTRETRRMLNDSMQEMIRLFHEGMDINIHTFSSLKAFPFFHNVGHWLLPYDKSRPDVPDNELISLIPLCDSDKYSVAALLSHLSESQRVEMKQNIEKHANVFIKRNHEPKSEYKNVIQCLYRLLKRSPWTSLWPDVFTSEMLFIRNPLFEKLITSSPQYLYETGNMLLRFNYYEAAELHLSKFAQIAGTDSTLLMQLGHCMQQQGKYSSAIRHYQQARSLEPGNPLILYRLQYCLAQAGRYEEQLECLLKLEEKSPEDPKILTEVGLCLIQLKRWEEAERRFYKLEFKGKRVIPSIRAIAWCCLNRGEYETAKSMYLRIFNERPNEATWEDYLNNGHAVWLGGDISAAIAFYTEYAHRYMTTNPDVKDALFPYTEDYKLLLSKGLAQEDINLMYDLISEQL